MVQHTMQAQSSVLLLHETDALQLWISNNAKRLNNTARVFPCYAYLPKYNLSLLHIQFAKDSHHREPVMLQKPENRIYLIPMSPLIRRPSEPAPLFCSIFTVFCCLRGVEQYERVKG